MLKLKYPFNTNINNNKNNKMNYSTIENLFNINKLESSKEYITMKHLYESIRNGNYTLLTKLITLTEGKNSIFLDFSNLGITDEILGYILNGIKQNNYPIQLSLSRNLITNEGIKMLCNILKTNTTLTVLYLYDNKITKHIAYGYLSEWLIDNNTLQAIYIKNANITSLEKIKSYHITSGGYDVNDYQTIRNKYAALELKYEQLLIEHTKLKDDIQKLLN